MKKYFAQLRPMERRLVLGVAVVLLVVLNWVFVWPHASDFGNYQRRLASANEKLKNYRKTVAELPDLEKKISAYEDKGDIVETLDQGVNFLRTIQMQSAQSSVQLQDAGRTSTSTNNAFFVEQIQTIKVLSLEANLVDFLYKLGAGPSMVRVHDLSLQPDAPHQRLQAEIRLVASYQKTSPASAAKTATATAK
jgi:type II secretory pathway component PulM